MKTRINFHFFALVSLCLFGLAAFTSGCSGNGGEQAQPAPTVLYFKVVPQRVELAVTLLGQVSAFTVSDVRPQVNGIIQERLFEEGAEVEAGQPLYKIDPSLYQAAYDNAAAELNRARATAQAARLLAQRYGKIVDAGAVSRQEHDDAQAAWKHAEAAVESARQALESARINLDYTTVTAPVSGIIGRSFVTPGALVTAHQPTPLATIQQFDKVYVDVPRASADLLRWKRALERGEIKSAGQNAAKARLLLDDGTPYARNDAAIAGGAAPDWIEGKLLFSDVSMDQSTGMVNLRVEMPNPYRALLPGMFVRAILEEGLRDDAILVPQRAVTYDQRGAPQVHVLTREAPNSKAGSGGDESEAANDEKPKALAADEYYAVLRPVTVDRDYGFAWLISSGLAPGDLVVVDGFQKIIPGQPVRGEQAPPEELAPPDMLDGAATTGPGAAQSGPSAAKIGPGEAQSDSGE